MTNNREYCMSRKIPAQAMRNINVSLLLPSIIFRSFSSKKAFQSGRTKPTFYSGKKKKAALNSCAFPCTKYAKPSHLYKISYPWGLPSKSAPLKGDFTLMWLVLVWWRRTWTPTLRNQRHLHILCSSSVVTQAEPPQTLFHRQNKGCILAKK